jgi:hypothetical protein
MGREARVIKVHTYVSRHNSPKDHRDDALHELLQSEINMLVKEPRYEPIAAEIEGWDGY